MTLNAKIGGFMDFLAISGCATELSLCDPNKEFGIFVLPYREHTQFSAKLLNRNCYRLSRVS